jgi:hypothetical protein
MDSWLAFEACEEIPYESIKRGASVIPLRKDKRKGDTKTTQLRQQYKRQVCWKKMR